MTHVKKIENLIEEGELTAAYDSLENLLALGPNNLEALKLKAYLFESEGRFDELTKIWHKIFSIDDEDEDALFYIHKKQIEDREHFYFSDEINEGGRRYLAYPKALVKISLLGLIGCISFLFLSKFSASYAISRDPLVVAITFIILVMSPWAGIIFTYSRSIHTISVLIDKIEVATRFKVHTFLWSELDSICLCHSDHPGFPNLRLILIPKKEGRRPIAIDMNEDTSAIRARSHLTNDIGRLSNMLTFAASSSLQIDDKNLLVF